ncbi:hypothetical protein J1782_24970 [Rahnella sp. BCC 1045]|uniref:hypothetical protein n=1 Tax=Rahnella sp. BCC 1045 TaxID=2816251 RepID=UPI001C257D69|nr:hypothetical protein [Rahnella sp. BCC 1045]MBU9823147.1 hypothetical protein [Rahnella sp. BCC 1045]
MSKQISQFKPDDVVYVVKLGVQFPEFYKGTVEKVTAAQIQIKRSGSYVRPERPSVCKFYDNYPVARAEFIREKLQADIDQNEKQIQTLKNKIKQLQEATDLPDSFY